MRVITKSMEAKGKVSQKDGFRQKQRTSRMAVYQKNMMRNLNRKKTNHHMIRKG